MASQVKKQDTEVFYKWSLQSKDHRYDVFVWWYKNKNNRFDAVQLDFPFSVPDGKFLIQLDCFLDSRLFQKLTVSFSESAFQDELFSDGMRLLLRKNGFHVYDHPEKKRDVEAVKFFKNRYVRGSGLE